jgi:hypothetical protein
MKRALLLGMFAFLIAGCGKKGTSPKELFEVKVVGTEGRPVAGATIEGGMDWDFFHVKTDDRGIATLPGQAEGKRAEIYKTNYFPHIVQSLSATQYTLNSTPRQFRRIGDATGKAIRFDSGALLTIAYTGDYHVYSCGDQEISEIASAQLARNVKETKLRGDTLWFSTHQDGIYAYSLQNPLDPQQLFHLDISGYLGPFALKDTIIAVGDPWDPGPLRIFSYTTDGQCRELSSVRNYFVRQMVFSSNYLILVGGSESLPTVFDLQDPANPRLVYNGLEWESETGFLFGQNLILVPRYGHAVGTVDFRMLNLSDPSHPISAGEFSADSWLTEIVCDSLAVGSYYFRRSSVSVLTGDLSHGFQTAAIVYEAYADGFGGCDPPYFIMVSGLYKMEDQ